MGVRAGEWERGGAACRRDPLCGSLEAERSLEKERDEMEGRFSAALAMGERIGEMGVLEWEKLRVGEE
jgi:hypothetical protein